MSKYAVKDLIAEVEYELSQRATVYKRLIENKRMKRETAEDHYRKMQAVKVVLEQYGQCYESIEFNKKPVDK
jgi:hypothetical protein